jgi:uncharacterized phage-associated protein
MPYSAISIALAFTLKGIEERKFVTQMKLQKLVYFAHGVHLAKYNTPLINEQIEAWKYGPVVPDIYRYYKLYGSNLISDIGLLPVNESALSIAFDKHAQDSINYTWKVLKDIDPIVLSQWTHIKHSPWGEVFQPNITNIPIDNDSIKNYFKLLIFNKQDAPSA